MKRDWSSEANLKQACETIGLSSERNADSLSIIEKVVRPTTTTLSELTEELQADFKAIQQALSSLHENESISLAELSQQYTTAAEAEKVIGKWRDAIATTTQFYLLELMSQRAEPKRKRFGRGPR